MPSVFLRPFCGWFLIGLAFTGATGEANADSTNPLAQAERPASWAVKLDQHGLRNFYRVTTNLYRGAQPSKEGMAELKAMGIKTVVDLRVFHSDQEKLGTTGLAYERFGVEPWHAEDADVIRFLKIATDTNNLPVFVHCEHGADRTGVMCAMYRVAVCGWTKDEAIAEMTRGGFGFHPEWQNLIHYVRHADIEKIKHDAGLDNRPQGAPKK